MYTFHFDWKVWFMHAIHLSTVGLSPAVDYVPILSHAIFAIPTLTEWRMIAFFSPWIFPFSNYCTPEFCYYQNAENLQYGNSIEHATPLHNPAEKMRPHPEPHLHKPLSRKYPLRFLPLISHICRFNFVHFLWQMLLGLDLSLQICLQC